MVLRTPGGSFVRKSLLYGGSPESCSALYTAAEVGNGSDTSSTSSSSPPNEPSPATLTVNTCCTSQPSFRRVTSASYSFSSFSSMVSQFDNLSPPLGSPREQARTVPAPVLPFERTWADDVIRFVVISDTHCRHEHLAGSLPPGDVLIHAGDFTSTGTTPQVESFRDFLQQCPHDCKVVIAGNHDITLHEEYYERIGEDKFHRGRRDGPYFPAQCRRLLTGLQESHNVRYLENSECDIQSYCQETAPGRVKVWGSPWTPAYQNWAFNYEPGSEQSKSIWASCPTGVDVLISHGPPLGVGDLTVRKVRAGCPDLLKEVRERIRPRVHIFGHIHEGYGVYQDEEGITYINASTSTVQYRATNGALVFDLPLDTSQPIRWVSEVPIQCLDLSSSLLGPLDHKKKKRKEEERGLRRDGGGMVVEVDDMMMRRGGQEVEEGGASALPSPSASSSCSCSSIASLLLSSSGNSWHVGTEPSSASDHVATSAPAVVVVAAVSSSSSEEDTTPPPPQPLLLDSVISTSSSHGSCSSSSSSCSSLDAADMHSSRPPAHDDTSGVVVMMAVDGDDRSSSR